jgi:hypothetical protein
VSCNHQTAQSAFDGQPVHHSSKLGRSAQLDTHQRSTLKNRCSGCGRRNVSGPFLSHSGGLLQQPQASASGSACRQQHPAISPSRSAPRPAGLWRSGSTGGGGRERGRAAGRRAGPGQRSGSRPRASRHSCCCCGNPIWHHHPVRPARQRHGGSTEGRPGAGALCRHNDGRGDAV